MRPARITFDNYFAPLNLKTPLLEEPNSIRKYPMLLLQNARRQSILIVTSDHRHRGLHNYRTGIDARRHEEHTASRDFDSILNRVLRPVNSRKRREQARVDIHDARRKRVEHHRREKPHETRQ